MKATQIHFFFFLLFFIPLSQSAVRFYSLNIVGLTLAPNGVSRPVFAFNGTIPGPTLYANVGDNLLINVTNYLDDLGTSVHWHGIFQTGSPQYDGVAYVTQCPIAPNTWLLYNYTVQQWGTYFYHSHVGTQIGDGLRGALVIYNNPEIFANYYDQEIVIHLSDWYNTPLSILLLSYLSPASGGNEPIPDSTIINGNGYYDCRLTNATCQQKPHITNTFTVSQGTRYRLRILNTGTFAHYHFSIDNHNLTIIESDGVDYNLYTTGSLEINVAERYSVLLHANQPISNYWIRVGVVPHDFSLPLSDKLFARAVLRYQGATGGRPTSMKNNDGHQNYLNLVPFGSPPAPGPVTVEITLNIVFQSNASGVNVAYINNATYLHPATPILYTAYYDYPNFPSSYSGSVYQIQNRGDVVQLNINNFDTGEHPLHIHGHNFAVLAMAPGVYDPNTSVLNTVSPPYRDTATVKAGSYMVWRFVANNPGVWFFHCHINWHLNAGFALIFDEIPSEQHSIFAPLSQTVVNCPSPDSDNS